MTADAGVNGLTGMGSAKMEISPSGIPGLDKLLQGGFPRGAVILLAGNPGTGKTTFAAKFLYEGALQLKEPGIYVSFVEPRHDFLRHMASLGMEFEPLEEEGLFRYVEALTVADEETLASQLEDIIRTATEMNAKRVVIDSISAILQILQDKPKVRELLQNFFVNGLKPLGITSVLIAEYPYGARVVGHGIEEFIVDAVFILRFKIEQGKLQRILELRKARWAPIHQAELPFYMRPGIVVEISLPEEPEEVPPVDYTRTCNVLEALLALSIGGEKLIEVSLPGTRRDREDARKVLSSILSIPGGAQVLVGLSSTVSSKLIASLLAAALTRESGRRTLVVSFKSSPQSIMSLVRCLACSDAGNEREGGGDSCRVDDLLYVVSLNPTAYTVNEINDMIDLAVRRLKPDIAITEGLEILEAVAGKGNENSIAYNMYNMVLRYKRRGITGLWLQSFPLRQAMLKQALASMFDMGIYIEGSPYTSSQLMGRASKLALGLSLEVYHAIAHTSFNMLVDTYRLLRWNCFG
ncbi:hypothetical protein CF15_07395 [Pyrodictium occultum]|uniref:KaiC domain-containing protein n=1 Tax=Pyrodictium occultum TaxID=2309 RepID=A0A0V8RWZ1_PYROC|nr:ATPase domain-containing protein [Pyrodictium occultum]KSW12536.1 hypothetical protein CF15_07395 [Pyrodictium occultum]